MKNFMARLQIVKANVGIRIRRSHGARKKGGGKDRLCIAALC
jgi:hypothetical protein